MRGLPASFSPRCRRAAPAMPLRCELCRARQRSEAGLLRRSGLSGTMRRTGNGSSCRAHPAGITRRPFVVAAAAPASATRLAVAHPLAVAFLVHEELDPLRVGDAADAKLLSRPGSLADHIAEVEEGGGGAALFGG